MATYTELFDLRNYAPLKNRITVGCIIAAEIIRGESGGTTNHANRLIWAKAVFRDPDVEALRIFWALLAQNAGATVSQIQNVTDNALQTAVNNVIDLFATGA